ncbi:MAG TPA: aminotransferase class I/II-fold pyridoxal phosphate-dependent enzyme [Candidatus Saccharimonadales bacterium]|nr:aminotransferase class I/II-fold pyridoxal phosphate-dependent enzyme [Candidatus Saccharimonadales bacterium]
MNSTLLDANEHCRQWVKLPVDMLEGLNRYPDRYAVEFRKKLTEHYVPQFGIDNILPTAGSIEAIDLLITALQPSKLIVNVPGYDVYGQRASAHGVITQHVPFISNGQPDVSTIMADADKNSLVILIHPNNPTGKLVTDSIGCDIIDNFPGLVVIDEAYIEYAGLEKSFDHFVLAKSNLIVLRTFSKAWGLAGVRLGYVIAHPALIQRLASYQSIYSVSRFALEAGVCALTQSSQLQAQVAETLGSKRLLYNQLSEAGIPTINTHANFLLINPPNVRKVHRGLQAKSILVRPRKLIYGEEDLLRLTVGSKSENELFYRVLLETIKE